MMIVSKRKKKHGCTPSEDIFSYFEKLLEEEKNIYLIFLICIIIKYDY